MVRIKVCGNKSHKDIEILNAHKPDYAGFIFANSKRQVSPKFAKELIIGLDSNIKRVGVFVNSEASDITDIVRSCGLDVIQLHGDEPQEVIEQIKSALPSTEVWKAIRVTDSEIKDKLDSYSVDAYLLDTFNKGLYGGTGEAFNWQWAEDLYNSYRLVLAGGLNLTNVNEAIAMVRPYCVDLNSGVETDGAKDERKIAEIILSIREGM